MSVERGGLDLGLAAVEVGLRRAVGFLLDIA
jgi:hypothetical protein